jgi:tetratricopeptide (TPR) repeat protein
MKLKFLLLIVFLLVSKNYYSQDIDKQKKAIDSLWIIVTDKNAYLTKGSKEMLRMCTEVYYQVKEINYGKGELRALVKMSEIYTNEKNYEEGLKKISEGLELAERNDNYVIWSDLLRLQSANFLELGYYKKANQSARKALNIADNIVEADRKYFARSSAFKKIGDIIKK